MVIVFAVTVGSADLSVLDSLRLIAGRVPGLEALSAQLAGSVYERIIWQVRLPRVLLACLVGGALASVGGAFQSIFRNPLADPHILGVSAGAALGATLAMVLEAPAAFGGLGAVSAFAFFGALAAVFFVWVIAHAGGALSGVNMLLTGTAVSTLLSGIISLLMTFHQDELNAVYMWTMGSFSAATWPKVAMVGAVCAVGMAVLMVFASRLNVLLAGEDEARTLGVNTGSTRGWVILFSSLMVATAVSVSGIVGFVGLIVPHCIRLLMGPDNRRLLPCAFVLGGIFLVLCDTLARTVAAPTEVPVGVVTAVLGAPYFIALVTLRRHDQR